jgi:hypothetical protein
VQVRRGKAAPVKRDAKYEGAKRGPFKCGTCMFWAGASGSAPDATAKCNVPDRAAKNIPEMTERGGCCCEWDK